MVLRGFWRQTTKRPFFASAPLAEVTDCAFRYVIAKYGKPDVVWTEFVSVDGLLHSPSSFNRLKKHLQFTDIERPIVAQIFGKDPKKFYDGVQLLKELKFDGVDINMGCPDRIICKNGCGAALIEDMKLAQKIVLACKNAGGEEFPVSVKTRIGYNQCQIDEWMHHLLDVQPDAITLHLRTKKEMSLVPAQWTDNVIGHAVHLKHTHNSPTLIIGNGDISNLTEGHTKATQFGLDGIMIGRGLLGTPWLLGDRVPPLEEHVDIMVEHTKLWKLWVGVGFHGMRKHYKAYLKHVPRSRVFLEKLMETKEVEEAMEILGGLKKYVERRGWEEGG